MIAALPNKDWRKAAEELRAGRNTSRRKQLYIPEAAGGGMSMQRGDTAKSAASAAGVDAINTEEVVGGLSARPALPPSGRTEEAVEQVRQEVAAVDVSTPTSEVNAGQDQVEDLRRPPPPPGLSEEQRALRELLGHDATAETEQIPDAILSAPDNRGGPLDETEAFKRDVDTRPDEVSMIMTGETRAMPIGRKLTTTTPAGLSRRLCTSARRSIRHGDAQGDGLAARASGITLGARCYRSSRAVVTPVSPRDRRQTHDGRSRHRQR